MSSTSKPIAPEPVAAKPVAPKPAPADETAKALGLLASKIDAMDTRHAADMDRIDKRFDAVDARFDGIDARFRGLDARLEGMDARFDGIDRKIEILMENQVEQFRLLKKLAGE